MNTCPPEDSQKAAGSASGTTTTNETSSYHSDKRTGLPQPNSSMTYLATLLERGDITGSSFGFLEPKQRWGENEHGYPVRYVTELTLDHISPVASPAYPTSSAEVRI